MITHKVCCGCLVDKPLADYYVHSRKCGLRLGSRCKVCHGEAVRKYRLRNPEKVKADKTRWYRERGRFAVLDKAYKRNYNSTELAYDLQFASQNHCCAICLRPQAKEERRFAFDHDHETGAMRGVLCSACNGGLGCFRDNVKALRTAIEYLTRWTAQQAPREEAS